jgi:hypothetical protein
MSADSSTLLRKQLVWLLDCGDAHLSFEDVIKDWPKAHRGVKPPGAAHTAWQLLEHLRIAQWDIVEFCRNPQHKSPAFPGEYWPPADAPPSDSAWEKSVAAVISERKAMMEIISDPAADLFARVGHADAGPEHTLLREALLLADHNAYHIGQLVQLRRMLGS